MKIINETCYNTEDIRDLLLKCQATVTLSIEAKDLPERLLISYWEGCRETSSLFVNYNYDYTRPRLGIVRSGKLGVAPLVSLAQAADGLELKLPHSVITEIATYFASLLGGDRVVSFNLTNHHWKWLEDFEVRYSARAKSGSKDEAKLARAEDALARLEQKFCDFDRLIQNAKIDIECVESELANKKAVLKSRVDRKAAHLMKIVKSKAKVAKLREKVTGKSAGVTISSPKRVGNRETTQ